MSIKNLAQKLTVAVLLVGTSTAIAADSARGCDPGAIAAAYDRRADVYEAAAVRYRAWARAEGVFPTGRSDSGSDLAQQAVRLEEAATQSRARAAESRSDSVTASGGSCAEMPANG